MTRQHSTAVFLLAGALLTGCGGSPSPDAEASPSMDAGAPSGLVTLEPMPGEPPVLDLEDQIDLLEQPIPSIELYDFLDGLHSLAGDSPDNGGTALGEDGRSLTLYWFGSPPDEVLDLIGEYVDRVAVEVVATPLRPGDLRAEAERLVTEYAPMVQGAGPRIEGDGLTVTVSTAAVERAGSVDAVVDELDSSFPLVGEVGDVVPA